MWFDLYTVAQTARAIERARAEPGLSWRPGQRLRLLFAGYNGARNTGSDVRVEEMLRQVRHVLGDKHVELSVLTINPALSRGYFKRTLQLTVPAFFPPALPKLLGEHHGAIACEGSMFKSNFGNALPALMVGVLGAALAQDKPAVGYGAEAGRMDAAMRLAVARYCRGALVLTRNEASRGVLAELGIASELGADTAWTFEPAPREAAEKLLRDAGWDGERPVLAVCPMNPFWWPLRPSLAKKALLDRFGWFQDSHARTLYFHRTGAEVTRRFDRYVDALAQAVGAHAREHGLFVAVIGMEALDRRACEALGARLGAPTFVSDRHTMYELVALLRRAALLVTSRFHAAVCSMPAGVPSIAVSLDERLENLLRDRGTPELLLRVSDDGLAERLVAALRSAQREADGIAARCRAATVENLRRMAGMGKALDAHVHQRYPELPRVPRSDDWTAWLPPLGPGLQALLAEQPQA